MSGKIYIYLHIDWIKEHDSTKLYSAAAHLPWYIQTTHHTKYTALTHMHTHKINKYKQSNTYISYV